MRWQKLLNPNTTTRMALRAACAALLCILFTQHFYLTRGYWAILTALSLITPSLGTSIYQSSMRFIMTIDGCFIGWGIYIAFKYQPEILTLITLIILFIMVYTLYHNFILRMIVTGIAVVILFSFIGGWDLQLLWVRAYETLIGAVIAVLVNALIFPEFAKNNVQRELKLLLEKIFKMADDIATTNTLPELKRLSHRRKELDQTRITLERHYEYARYELFLRKNKSLYYDKLHLEINLLCFYFQAMLNIKISALKYPDSVRAYLAASGTEYYQERIDQELTNLRAIASATQKP